MTQSSKSDFRARIDQTGGVPLPDMATAVRGAIAFGAGKSHIGFHFGYGEIPVTGDITSVGETCRLNVSAPVGIVPYSAEDADARRRLCDAVTTIEQAWNGGIDIDCHQIIRIHGECLLKPPMTAVTIISGLVRLMHDLRPLFDMACDYLPDLHTALPASQAPGAAKAGSAAA